MGKNEKKILSAISPAYALSKGRLPSASILGGLANNFLDKRDEKKRKEELKAAGMDSESNNITPEARENAGVDPRSNTQLMSAGGRTRRIDGIARQGRTRGRKR